jgi:hypothetical protein
VFLLAFLVFRLCLLYSMLPVSLDSSFVIAPSGFSNFYLYTIKVEEALG